MPYNWKYYSFYPNNFGASALHFVVYVFPQASGNTYTGQWKHVHRPVDDS